jgi:hypothetical protein
MEHYEWIWFSLARLSALVERARLLPPDIVLAIAGYCGLVALLALLGWGRAAAACRKARRALTVRTEELLQLQNKYESEKLWRAATERYEANEETKAPATKVELEGPAPRPSAPEG